MSPPIDWDKAWRDLQQTEPMQQLQRARRPQMAHGRELGEKPAVAKPGQAVFTQVPPHPSRGKK